MADLPVTLTSEVSVAAALPQLEKVLASKSFAGSSRLSRFLRYVVEQTIEGHAASLKEYKLGLEVFDLSEDFDPRVDAVVRVEARQVRFKLADYYAGPGTHDEIVISLPKGGYAARFERRAAEPPVQANRQEPAAAGQESVAPAFAPSGIRSRRVRVLGAVLVLLGLLAVGVSVRQWYAGGHSAVKGQNAQAEDLYLRGIHAWQRRTPESLSQAVDLFTQAIVHDPGNAKAYVGLANCYNLLREFSRMPEEEAFPRALAATTQALKLDDRLAEAHASLAFISIWWNWNAAAADREFRRAIELDPKYATAHHWYATFLLMRREFQKALGQITLAQRLEPSSPSILADKAVILFASGRTEEAMNRLRDVTKIDRDLQSSHLYLMSFYASENDYAGYLNELKQTADISGAKVWQDMARAGETGFRTGGRDAMFDSILAAQKELYRIGLQNEYDLAATASRSGRKREAMQYLERAAKRRKSSGVLFYRIDLAFQNLHSYPEFQRFDAEFESKLSQGLFPPRENAARAF
ncbi:MAG: tetratricopeptide repeat protein [Bryobacteraceae bacterium]